MSFSLCPSLLCIRSGVAKGGGGGAMGYAVSYKTSKAVLI